MSPLLLETIKIERGEAQNLSYHQARVNKSRADLFQTLSPIDLSSVIKVPEEGLYRCRIIYSTKIESIEYLPYVPKSIETLKIIPSSIEYRYKYADRRALDALLEANPDTDEIIIEKDGLLTDTTIANIAFFDGSRWYTPKTPLLEGTLRKKFLDKGLLLTRDITKKDLKAYTHVALMNAMIGFKILNHITIK
ncbi:aminotransferase class IV family protein [Sulfurovum sp. ST-21]|uniref:Aminotransferase class IV n=1 Tax=Sulfurovum indicum TaxID=2779528 RepID=A0A7M1S299_9BACT|nr:aminotransferase class IV family protein [Sulfurovum indicum]QOR61573.1 aminotransferase class IV [Sulfurovum indicum]